MNRLKSLAFNFGVLVFGVLGLTSAVQAQKPEILSGWPQQLPGSITGAPVAADVDGDGKLEVIAPAMGRWQLQGITHPEPTLASQLWALSRDGKVLENWPITLRNVESRLADRKADARYAETWNSSPSVWDINGDGADEIVITSSGHDKRDIRTLYGDGGNLQLAPDADSWVSVPLCDLDGDKIPDIAMGFAVTSVLGEPVKTWPLERVPKMAYGSAMGDIDNDGDIEVFMPFYDKDWHLPGQPENRSIGGFSHTGEVLDGWPRQMPSVGMHVVAGDVTGDDKKEVIAVDSQGTLHVWTHGGEVLWGAGKPIDPKIRFATRSVPTLADLDGDGKAEIVLSDILASIYAFHGDGKPWRAQNGGVIAGRAQGLTFAGEVSVVDLGGDDVWDFFVGTSWIRATKEGETQIVSLLPEAKTVRIQNPITQEIEVRPLGSNARNDGGCSVLDFDADGDGDVIFGLSDGRVYVVKTGLKWLPQHAQWPTPSGNFQHTGFWRDPKTLK